MLYKEFKRVIYPDKNSWLSEILIDFFKEFKNEYSLTLWEALNEFVEFHSPYCAYKGKAYEGPVELYPLLSYDSDKRIAKLEKLFFLSKSPKIIFTHDYLSVAGETVKKTPFLNFLNKKNTDESEDYPEIEFMISNNNIEPSLAREILLKTSYNRRCEKRIFIFENESKGIEFDSINVATIQFDLSLLEKSKFLEAKRYESFKELLPSSLKFPISCKLNYEIPSCPVQLKKQQLIDVSSIAN